VTGSLKYLLQTTTLTANYTASQLYRVTRFYLNHYFLFITCVHPLLHCVTITTLLHLNAYHYYRVLQIAFFLSFSGHALDTGLILSPHVQWPFSCRLVKCFSYLTWAALWTWHQRSRLRRTCLKCFMTSSRVKSKIEGS